MKIDGFKITIGIDTIREWFKVKKEKSRVRVGEVLEIKGYNYRVYDADDDGFKVYEDKDECGMADKHKPVQG